MVEFVGAATPLDGRTLGAAAGGLKVEPEALWALAIVETGGCGFLLDRRPKLLFERHLFRRLTGSRFDMAHPAVSGPPGGYGAAGAHQYERLAEAIGLDRVAALKSASWGLGQTLGEYHHAAGYADVEAMVAAYVGSEAAQLRGLAAFIGADPVLLNALRARDWASVARRYNGPNYAGSRYDRRLADAFAAVKAHGLPDWTVRAAGMAPMLALVPAPAR